jgi:putative hydrolase of the HAD superfamily
MNSPSAGRSKAGAKSPEAPAAVVFDLGKVLVDFDYGIASARIAARGNCSPSAVRELIDHSPLLFRFETGRLTAGEFFEEIREKTGFQGDRGEFEALFADIFHPIPSMISSQQQLRARGVATFLFSNTNELAAAHIRRSFPFFSTFDGYILSYEQGSMKPDEAIYEVVERIAGLKGSRLIYFDDRPENVHTALRRGWRAVVHENEGTSIGVLRSAALLE